MQGVNENGMKVEEPVFVYQATPSVANLRKLIVNHVEHEDNVRVLQQLLVFVEQLHIKEPSEKKLNRTKLNKKIAISKRIKALSAVPPALDNGDYKEDLTVVTSEKYM